MNFLLRGVYLLNSILPDTFPTFNPVPALREQAGSGLVVEKNVYDLVDGYEHPSLGWESYQVRDLIKTETENWVFGLADWKSFLSLTFRDEKTPDVALSLFKWFIREQNEHAFGKHYTRRVGHSYFSYVFGLEYQTRDVVHFHALVDKPLDFSFIHKTWGERCGFAWIDGKLESKAAAVNYVCKYCVKGGQIDAFVNKKSVFPNPLPSWWVDDNKVTSNYIENASALSNEAVSNLQNMWNFIISSKSKPDQF